MADRREPSSTHCPILGVFKSHTINLQHLQKITTAERCGCFLRLRHQAAQTILSLTHTRVDDVCNTNTFSPTLSSSCTRPAHRRKTQVSFVFACLFVGLFFTVDNAVDYSLTTEADTKERKHVAHLSLVSCLRRMEELTANPKQPLTQIRI